MTGPEAGGYNAVHGPDDDCLSRGRLCVACQIAPISDEPDVPPAEKLRPSGLRGGVLTPRWTERDLLDRLHARHAKDVKGNGPVWVYMEHVRSSAGFDALNTIDALALHLWRSRHHEAHAYEVKVSRADFRRELADDCGKSAVWRAWVDYFWIVAPPDIVPLDELPAGWGLLVTQGAGLRVKRQAKRLRPRPTGYMPAPDLPRDVVAPMLRAAARTAERKRSVDIASLVIDDSDATFDFGEASGA